MDKTIWIKEEILKELKIIAINENKKLQELVNEIFVKYLEKK